uniref:Uncharacterized protein n=1 Tax=Octopus bimaculoides TaxID=37653 RepID=A0A0L8HEX3_OCTBM
MKGKTHWDAKRKRHVPDTPKQRYLAKAVRLFNSNLADVKTSDRFFDFAVKVTKRCYEKCLKGELDSAEKNPKRRVAGGGRKTKAAGVRDVFFEWFVNVRTSLHVRLPQALFLLNAEKFYEEWICEHPDYPTKEKLCFSKS